MQVVRSGKRDVGSKLVLEFDLILYMACRGEGGIGGCRRVVMYAHAGQRLAELAKKRIDDRINGVS